MTTCGIYRITNLLNGKSYVGQSVHIEERWKRHRYCPKEASHLSLYQDIKKFGIENFRFEILEECLIEQLNEKEVYWIKTLNTYFDGYNNTRGGSGFYSGHPVRLSEEDIIEIIDLLQHSTILQKDIATMFQVGEDTISEINHGKTRYNPELKYPLRNHKKEQKYCIDCQTPVKYGDRCVICSNKLKAKQQRQDPNKFNGELSREELKQLIRTMPFTQIGKKYGVSDNAIRKWCDKYGLPRKVSEIKSYTDEEWTLL